MKETISLEGLKERRENYCESKADAILRHALSNNEIESVVRSKDEPSSLDYTFSIDIKTLPATDQKSSGRCWIFSACNVLREMIAKKLNIKDQFEISQNFIAYYDKLEKYNYYLENVLLLALKGEKHDSRRMEFLLKGGVGDGGQWDMFKALVKKYGIVPKSAFPETYQSENTRCSRNLCNCALRQFAADIYKAIDEKKGEEELYKIKDLWFNRIYKILTSSFGLPPEKFDFKYIDNDDNYHILKDLTPKEFFNTYIGSSIDEFVSIIHAPTKDKEYYQTYNVELVGNVIEAKPITHLNLPYERLEELIIEELKNGQIVWFGSDVGQFRDRLYGTWSTFLFDYESPFDFDMKFDKADMLDYYHSCMGHAMCITGVDIQNGKPTQWKIENSWGDQTGKKGYFIMNEEFFTHFVYQAAIEKRYLNEKELEALDKESKLLPPWDPFGTLAD